MSKTLLNYIRQRIHPGLMLGLCVFIMLYSTPAIELTVRSLLSFIFLFITLILFRLYDDLMQALHDEGKPNRDYTNRDTRQLLFTFLFACSLFFIGIIFLFKIQLGCAFLFFVIINHILYLLFIKNKIGAGLLPLLKYPFLFYIFKVVNGWDVCYLYDASLLFQAIALYSAFVAFECMEDESFPIPRSCSYVLQILSFILLPFGSASDETLVFCISLFVLSLLFNYSRWKSAPYLFLLFLLVFKITAHVSTY